MTSICNYLCHVCSGGRNLELEFLEKKTVHEATMWIVPARYRRHFKISWHGVMFFRSRLEPRHLDANIFLEVLTCIEGIFAE
jgi:hypothetical protein